MSHTYLNSYGVRLDVEVEDEGLQPAVELILPPGWEPSEEFPEDGHFTVSGRADGAYAVLVDGASGAVLALRLDMGCVALALSMALLLVVGIHNAWDITVWTVTRRRE